VIDSSKGAWPPFRTSPRETMAPTRPALGRGVPEPRRVVPGGDSEMADGRGEVYQAITWS
jgi:hypothetical protein